MILVEVYSGDESLWSGMLFDIPAPNSIIQLNTPPSETTQVPPKFYRLINVIWNVVDGYAIALQPPRLQVIEVDPSTGKAKQPLVQPVQTIH